MASVDWSADPAPQIERFADLQEPAMRDEVLSRSRRFLESPWAERIKSGSEWQSEVPFSVRLDGCRLFGQIDLLFREAGRWVIVDYKTGSAPDKEVYARQVRLYALAIEKCLGEPPAEVALVGIGDGPDFAEKIDSSLLAQVEADLVAAAEGIKAGRFPAISGKLCFHCGYKHLGGCSRKEEQAGQKDRAPGSATVV